MRVFMAAALVCGVALSNGVAVAAPAAFVGSWKGDMRQIESNTEKTYPIRVTFMRGGGATFNYPTCYGSWTEVTSLRYFTVYQEAVSEDGNCLDGAIVTVAMDRGKVVLSWFTAYNGAPTVATAVLSRVSE